MRHLLIFSVLYLSSQGVFAQSNWQAHRIGGPISHAINNVKGDVDGDGDIDLIALEGRRIALLLNDGLGNFSVPFVFDTLSITAAIFDLVDLDNDGDLDLALWSFQQEEIQLLINDGLGNFGVAQTLAVVPGYQQVRFVDINNDGAVDCVGLFSSELLLLKNNGAGSFLPETVMSNTFIGKPFSFGDVDNDGDEDFISSNSLDELFWQEFDNDSLLSPIIIADSLIGSVFPSDFMTIECADIDGDSDDDLLVSFKGFAMLYESNGGGNFSGQYLSYSTALNRKAIFVDADSDGDVDIYAERNTDLEYYENVGGTYGAAASVNALNTIGSNAFHDINGDGIADFVATGDPLKWHESVTPINLLGSSMVIYNGQVAASDISIGDIDGDGANDLLLSSWIEQEDSYYLNSGGGVFDTLSVLNDTLYAHQTHELVDIDGDADLDVLTGTGVYQNSGSGLFTQPYSGLPNVPAVAVYHSADVDNDGDLDLVYTTRFAPFQTSWIENVGGVFGGTPNQIPELSVEVKGLWTGDINGDSQVDFVIEKGAPVIWASNGQGGIDFLYGTAAGFTVEYLVDDIDGSGTTDLLILENGVYTIRFNIAVGPLQNSFETNSFEPGVAILRDLDNDTYPDLIFYDKADSTLKVLGNLGGWFSQYPISIYNTSSEIKHIEMGDLNGNGLNDFAISGDYFVNWIENPGIVLGTNPIQKSDHLALFPNPTTSDFVVLNELLNGNVAIKLYDNVGRLVLTRAEVANNGKLSLEGINLPEGQYTLRLINDWVVLSTSVIISN